MADELNVGPRAALDEIFGVQHNSFGLGFGHQNLEVSNEWRHTRWVDFRFRIYRYLGIPTQLRGILFDDFLLNFNDF